MAGNWLNVRVVSPPTKGVVPGGSPGKNTVLTGSRFQSARAQHPSVRLQERLLATGATFRYQRQIDLRSGRIAGVESVLCVPAKHGFLPAVELRADRLDGAGRRPSRKAAA